MKTTRWPQVTRTVLMAVSFVCLMGVESSIRAGSVSSPPTWNFESYPLDALPGGFEIGRLSDGRPAGEWKVREYAEALSAPHVLAQLSGKGAEHAYKMVLADGTESTDMELSVGIRAIGGKGDMGGGLIWRAVDDRNYYLTRINPLEQNIRLYRVDGGVRKLLANHDQTIDVRQWHRLKVVAQGCQMQVLYDDELVFDVCDQTLARGMIGLWTKSDAVTYFDDLDLTIHK